MPNCDINPPNRRAVQDDSDAGRDFEEAFTMILCGEDGEGLGIIMASLGELLVGVELGADARFFAVEGRLFNSSFCGERLLFSVSGSSL